MHVVLIVVIMIVLCGKDRQVNHSHQTCTILRRILLLAVSMKVYQKGVESLKAYEIKSLYGLLLYVFSIFPPSKFLYLLTERLCNYEYISSFLAN